MVKNYPSLEAFTADFRRFVRELSTGLVVEYHKANHEEGKALLQAEMNRASVTGDLAASLRDSTTGGFMDPNTMTRPGSTRVISLDKGFHAVDMPRSTISKPYRGGSRVGSRRRLGTDKAPRGFTTPAVQKLISKPRQAKLHAKAVVAAWRKAK